MMDKKILAIIAAAIIVTAGAGAFLLLNNDPEEKGLSVLARVNTEGSGLYLKSGEKANDYLEILTPAQVAAFTPGANDAVKTYSTHTLVFHKDKWGGKVIGTPGAATIQHMQVREIAVDFMKLKFSKYTVGDTLKADTVYYDEGVSNYTLFKSKNYLTGAYIWQPQYQMAVADGCTGLVLSDKLFPKHTCCVIAGTEKYLKHNESSTVQFLGAYIKSVDKLKSVIAAGSGTEYDELVALGVQRIGGGITADTVKESLRTITYTYGDSTQGDLSVLEASIVDLVTKYEADHLVKKTMSDLNFNSAAEFGKKFVNSYYLKKAVNAQPTSAASKTVTVAVIGGDIHQIALHYGVKLGYFTQYGINVELSSQSNGPGVATALQNGGADFGLLGAPPLTITTINGELIKG